MFEKMRRISAAIWVSFPIKKIKVSFLRSSMRMKRQAIIRPCHTFPLANSARSPVYF